MVEQSGVEVPRNKAVLATSVQPFVARALGQLPRYEPESGLRPGEWRVLGAGTALTLLLATLGVSWFLRRPTASNSSGVQDPSVLTVADLVEQGVVKELARCYPGGMALQMLLERARIDVADAPQVLGASPQVQWQAVLSWLEKGGGSIEPLLVLAHREFPGNQIFRRFAPLDDLF